MNFYKHHIGDFDQATRHLSFVEDAAYSRLIRKYYAEESPLPEDLKKIQRLIGARTKEEKAAVVMVLEEFFVLEEDGYHQTRCDEELEAARAKAEINRKVGKLGGRPKKLVTHAEPTDNPNGFLFETQTVSENNPSQTPVTSNQTPDLKPKPISPTGDSGRPANDDPDAPLAAAQISISLIGWERERHKAARGISASQQQVIELAEMHVTPDELRKAYDLAVADRLATNDPNAVNAGFVKAKLQTVRNPPKPRPKVDAWWISNEAMNAKAKEIGISPARAGEEPSSFRTRIQQALNAKEMA